jgi:hypothetical protein
MLAMRIRSVGTSLTVAELRNLLETAGTRDDAEVLWDDIGLVIGAEAGPLNLTLETSEVIDRDAQAEDHAEFVSLVASGKLRTLVAIRARAVELDY